MKQNQQALLVPSKSAAQIEFDKGFQKEAADIKSALNHYELSASLGSADAYFKLGNIYLRDTRIKRSVVQAVKYFEKAVSLGHNQAALNLATIYEEAILSKPSQKVKLQKKAINWLMKSATFGNQLAIEKLHKLNIYPLIKTQRPLHLPLSYAQQRLWFLQELLVNKATYNVPLVLQLEGQLNVDAFSKAFESLLMRHEVLRTIYQELNGEVVQIIQPGSSSLQVHDFSQLEIQEGYQLAQHQIQQDIDTDFDLSQGPLIRSQLIKLNENEHIWLVNIHHSISDGWSMGIFAREFSAYYNAYSQGKTIELVSLALQYADYTLWQRSYLQGETLQRQLIYWQELLHDAPETLNLPMDKPRPAMMTYAGAMHEHVLSQPISEGLKRLSEKAGATLFMSLLAVFQALLARYTQQTDIVIGAPIAGRHHAGLESLIGMFVNTLALRVKIRPEDSFLGLLAQVKQRTLEAYEHQDLPFEHLVEQLKLPRHLNRNPLFQVMFSMGHNDAPELILDAIKAQGIGYDHAVAKFDLSLQAQTLATGEILLGFEYSTELFEAETIGRMASHFEVLLEGIIQQPSKALAKLPVLTAQEQQLMLVEWNQTQAEYPKDQTLQQLFEAQVAKSPDAIALVYEQQQLSYRELNEKANQLAHYLRSLEVKPDTLVAISLERSLELIIGILAILKAGGAYVPLDPSYPVERLRFMLEDAQASVLITHSQFNELYSGYTGTCIELDSHELHEQVVKESVANPVCVNQSTNLAYVIYTSGSTGKPKGVMVSQENVGYYINWFKQAFGLMQEDVVDFSSSISFDLSVTCTLLPLTAGASIAICSEAIKKDVPAYVAHLALHRVTFAKLTPSYLEVINQQPVMALALRYLIVGGENLVTHTVEACLRHYPDVKVVNEYGPTETTVAASYLEVSQATLGRYPSSIPIGKPAINTKLYLLDAYQQPVPLGVTGELYIGGAGVARGYLNRPELTAEKFIENPFATEQDKQEGRNLRLYRTGDLVRYLADGNIEFLGRMDSQVKIRGYRIELGEIESQIRQQVSIADVAVIAREDEPGDKRLVAYLVDKAGVPEDIQAAEQLAVIREALAKQLPEYMVPSQFMYLERLPLNANGKLDRQALPKPEQAYRLEAFIAPQTGLEQQLAGIWAELLQLDVSKISVSDNFFTLGGHSLSATRLRSRIKQGLDVEISLQSIFKAPSLECMAKLISQSQAEVVRIEKQPRPEQLPLSYAQQRLWFLQELLVNKAAYNVPLVLKLTGGIKVEAFSQAYESLQMRHEVLRTVYQEVAGEAVQVIQPAVSPLQVYDLSHLASQERRELAQQQIQADIDTGFDLSQGPLLRSQLIKLSEKEYIWLVNLHHSISDGWSMGIFAREFSAYYEAYSQGKPVALAPLALQYADYTLWQRSYLQGEVLQRQLGYWQEQLRDAPEALNLPTDKPRPALMNYQGAVHQHVLSKSLSEGIKRLSEQSGATLFMSLLTVFQALLSRYSQQHDIVVGSPIAGRHHAEFEPLLGMFVNTLALRAQLEPEDSFLSLLAQVKRITLEAYEHQDLPFEHLVDHLKLPRHLNRNPLFQVMFSLDHSDTAEFNLGTIKAQGTGFDYAVAKFDLSLYAQSLANGELLLSFEYSTELFEAETIGRMASHFEVLLEGIIQQPSKALAKLPVLTAQEQQLMLVEWNQTQAEYPKDQTLQQLFEAQVAKSPDAIALVYEQQQLSYRELNEKANQLAHYLRSLEVKPDTLVAISLERSLELIIGILAILKAGGAYVPLDPSYPVERLRFMLEDTQAPVLITHSQFGELYSSYTGRCIEIDNLQADVIEQSIQNPACINQPQDLAYVIYTSGSTGQPKGVMGHHQGMVNRFYWMWSSYPFQTNENVCQKTSINFIDSVWEIFGGLYAGIKTFIFNDTIAKDPELLLLSIESHQISRLVVVPSLLKVLVDSQGTTKFNSLKICITSGEELPIDLVDKFKEKNPNVLLLNLYGSSEVAADVSYYKVDKWQKHTNHLPIGRPLANTVLYVLDKNHMPLPIGIAGELYAGGVGVARGYLNRPELTEERFIANPFASEQNKHLRLYRTGDWVRYLADGNIEFLGRIDSQVKIRGFRVELGEIENAIRQQLNIADVAVIAREDEPGDKRLVAYLVDADGLPEDTRAAKQLAMIREKLTKQLPEYMVPSSFMYLEQLPFNANGKLNRQGLPKPEQTYCSEEIFLRPQTELEQQLAIIWADLLQLDASKISRSDNFFTLGGHSLSATRLRARIRQELKVEISLQSLFEAPILQQMAKQVSQKSQGHVVRIERQPRPEQLPLSYAQQRLWFLHELLVNKAAYNIAFVSSLKGTLNQQAFFKAFESLLMRHEILRTVYAYQEITGEVIQVIAPSISQSLQMTDLSDLNEPQRSELARQQVQTDIDTGFNLNQGPLIRSQLIRLCEDEYIWLVNLHHSISDRWSIGIFVSEFSAYYNAYTKDKVLELSPLTLQYADYTLWQRDYLQGEILQRQLDYWQDQLKDAPEALSLPIDKPRPELMTYTGAVHEHVLSLSLSADLKHLGQQAGATLFMSLLTVFQALLSRYSQQTDIIVGIPIAGRHHAEHEPLIGMFVNTLALRAKIQPEDSFLSLLEQVKHITLGAYEHQDLPFEHLVDQLKLPRQLNRNPLFQFMFSLNHNDMSELALDSIKIQNLETDHTVAKFDLSLYAQPLATGEILLGFEYSTELFNEETVQRMALHFENLVAGIINQPNEPLAKLPLLTAKEQQLLIEWNQTVADYPADRVIYQLFETQVAQTPDAIAVVYEEQRLSYRELNARANQLAHYLRDLGVKSDTLVGISLERSLDLVIAILGVWKAGGAYVPLEPSYPYERLVFMLEDTQAPVLITHSQFSDRYNSYMGRSIEVDKIQTELAKQSVEDPGYTTQPQDLAYVIYTSGSTGKPKGVMVEHAALVNRIAWMQSTYQLNSQDRVLQKTPFSFDVSVWEFIWPLVSGAQLVVAEPEIHKDAAQLQMLIKQQKISVIHFVPSMLNAFIANQAVDCPSIRLLFTSGEALSYELEQNCKASIPQARLFNLYGPTEAAIDVTYWDCQQTSVKGIVPIGKPINNIQLYILDNHQQSVPVGVVGELYIKGIGLARGYLNRPQLTKEKFIVNPFASQQDKLQGKNLRLYRTGDLVRFLADGNIEFLGRIDGQVKIRGFRIELGEIESLLRQQTEIIDVAVIAREDVLGDRRLAAYLVDAKGVPTDDAQAARQLAKLQEVLVRHLPEYMVPTHFVYLDTLPLNANGKLDRSALPKPDQPYRQAAFEPLQTELEQQVAAIWAEVLGINANLISRHDSFFSLGGHSLTATRLLGLIQNRLCADVMLREVFNYPELASFSSFIQAKLPPSQELEVESAEKENEEDFLLDEDFADELEGFALGKLEASAQTGSHTQNIYNFFPLQSSSTSTQELSSEEFSPQKNLI